MKRYIIFSLLISFTLTCFSQKIISDSCVYSNFREIICSGKTFKIEKEKYNFYLGAVTNDTVTNWYLYVNAKDEMPEEPVIRMKLGNGQILDIYHLEKFVNKKILAHDGVIAVSETFSINFNPHISASKTYTHIDSIAKKEITTYTTVFKLSSKHFSHIQNNGIKKIRISSLNGFNECNLRENKLGEFLLKSRDLILKKSEQHNRKKEKAAQNRKKGSIWDDF